MVGINLHCRDKLKPFAVWGVLGKVIQSNPRFGLTDRLEVHLDHVSVCVQWRTEEVQTPTSPPSTPRNSEVAPKSCQTQPDCENCLGRQIPKILWKGIKIVKVPSVHNCFTLALTNKLLVNINSFKVPKINNILLHEMRFLVPNYSCVQNP